MASSSVAFARPVRSVAISLRKSSTAFSMRVLPAAIASLVVAKFILLPRSECRDLNALFRVWVSTANSWPSLGRGYGGTHSFTKHDSFDVPMLVHVEHHDGHSVVHAQGNRRCIHHLQIL